MDEELRDPEEIFLSEKEIEKLRQQHADMVIKEVTKDFKPQKQPRSSSVFYLSKTGTAKEKHWFGKKLF